MSFGRACEGEPLLSARLVEDAIRLIRGTTRSGTIHLETNGSVPAALRRLGAAGLDAVTIRIASARADTYETLHRPEAYRFADVRASLRVAAEQRLATSLVIPVLPAIHRRMASEDEGPDPTPMLQPPGFLARTFPLKCPPPIMKSP